MHALPVKLTNRRKVILSIFLIVCITLLSYSNSLSHHFVADDDFTILRNNFISSWSSFPRLFSKSYLSTGADTVLHSYRGQDYGSGEVSYRPTVTLSYMIDYSFLKREPFGYHLTNILLHAVNGILLYILLRLLTTGNFLALCSSLIFCSHPINTSVVNHISFREELLVVSFSLLAFILFLTYKKAYGIKRFIFYFFSCFSFFLAALSKEVAIVFPVLLVLYDYIFEFEGDIKRTLSSIKSRYLGYIIVSVCYLLIYFLFIGNNQPANIPYVGGTIFNHILTVLKIQGRYISSFFLPLQISIEPFHYAPIANSILDPEVLLSIGLLALLIYLGLRMQARLRVVSFGIFWFFVTMFPTSGIFVRLYHMFAFRYMYFAGIGFCVVLAVLCERLAYVKFLRERIPNLWAISAFLIIGFFVPSTIAQNMFWKNDFTVGKNQEMFYPDTPESQSLLIEYFCEQGFFQEGARRLEWYLKYRPYDAMAYKNLGGCYMSLGREDLAIEAFNMAVELRPDSTEAYYSLGCIYLEERRLDEAEESFKKVIEMDPEFCEALNNLGVTYLWKNEYEQAKLYFDRVFEIAPTKKGIKLNLELAQEGLQEQ
ncbi:tetratricopeptide repeat protein [Thermoproteota archaeon]